MSVTVNYSLEETQLQDLIDSGYTTLALYYASSPDGQFQSAAVTPSPATLAAAKTAGEPYNFTFTYTNGNPALWFKVVASDGSNTTGLNDAETFHGGGGTTLQRIRQMTGKLMHGLYTGTTTSNGSTTTAICAHPRFTRRRDNYFGDTTTGTDGWLFHNLSTGEWTEITGFTASTGTFTLSPAIASVGNGVNFEIMSRWTPEEYRDAINWAIVNTYPTLSKPVIDTSIVTEKNKFRYQVPNNIRILNNVELGTMDNDSETSLTSKWHPWRKMPYTPYDDGLNRYLEFKREPPFDEEVGGYVLRLTGTAALSQLYSDTDYVEVVEPQVELIIYMAAHRLYSLLPNDAASSDIDRWSAQSQYYLALYNEFKKSFGARRKPKTMWQQDARWVIR